MSPEKKDPPKCRKCGKVLKWQKWTGKPQPPVDPATGQPCDCWKKSGKFNYEDFGKFRKLEAKDLAKCPYCSGYYQKELGNERHEEIMHQDKKVHVGLRIDGWQCWEDEVLYWHGHGETWFMGRPDPDGEFHKVEGKENVEEFCKKHGIKHIQGGTWLLREGLIEDLRSKCTLT